MERVRVQCFEHFGAEGTGVVEVWVRMDGLVGLGVLGRGRMIVQISRVWVAFGWVSLVASFWPANLGGSAIAALLDLNARVVECGSELERGNWFWVSEMKKDGSCLSPKRLMYLRRNSQRGTAVIDG